MWGGLLKSYEPGFDGHVVDREIVERWYDGIRHTKRNPVRLNYILVPKWQSSGKIKKIKTE